MRRLISTVVIAGAVSANLYAQAPVEKKTWADNVEFKGDIRYRYETIADDSKLNKEKETFTRDRQRIRARLGAEAKCNDNVSAGIALSTGQSDPVSGNQTIGDGFGKKDFKLDQGYLSYKFSDSLKSTAGKMKNPFMQFQDDLIWDGDLTPEGIAFNGSMGGEMTKLLLNGGYFWVQERSSESDDTMLYGAQAAVAMEFMPEFKLTFGSSYYTFDNIAGYDVIDWEGKNNSYGNSTKSGSISGSTTNKAWKYDYTPIVYFAQAEVWVAGKPVVFTAQMLSNGEVDNLDAGYMYGVAIGKAKNPGTWEAGYSFAELEKDATTGMFTDSDRWGGGTDGKGHKAYAKYQIMKNLQAGITYFMDEKKISDAAHTKDYERMQVDLIAAF